MGNLGTLLLSLSVPLKSELIIRPRASRAFVFEKKRLMALFLVIQSRSQKLPPSNSMTLSLRGGKMTAQLLENRKWAIEVKEKASASSSFYSPHLLNMPLWWYFWKLSPFTYCNNALVLNAVTWPCRSIVACNFRRCYRNILIKYENKWKPLTTAVAYPLVVTSLSFRISKRMAQTVKAIAPGVFLR